MTLKALLFDFDGTLVNSEPTHFKIWQTLLGGYGCRFTEEEFENHYAGLPIVATVERLISHFGLSVSKDDLIQQKLAKTLEVFDEHPPALMPHVLSTLEWAKAQGLRLALVTGSSRDEVIPVFDHYHFERFFDTVVTRTDVVNSKPDPECYLKALDALHIQPDEGIALEDTHSGVMAAHNAHLDVIAIPNEQTSDHDFAHTVYIAKGLDDALGWIKTNRLDAR